MVEKQRPFPRFLIASGIMLWVICSMITMLNNFVGGLFLSSIFLIVLGAYCRVVAYLFESDVLMEISGEPGTPGGLSREAHERMLAREKSHGPGSRILDEPEDLSPAEIRSRLLDHSSDSTKDQRKEDREWADMARAL